MGNLLYLVHRLPYPPNKGDKVRSYHLLRHLQKNHRVFLGTFVDSVEDRPFVPEVRRLCPDSHIEPMYPLGTFVRRVTGMLFGKSLTVATFTSRRMQEWVDRVLEQYPIDACIVVSSSMAIYLADKPEARPLLMDVVDVDSAKWGRFALVRPWPMSWIFAREARLLRRHEIAMARLSMGSFFVTDRESALFQKMAPDVAAKVQTMGNGVDGAYFAPQPASDSPFAQGERTVVFVGTMDYWPNVDAASWFARQVLPLLRNDWPDLVFHVVGRSPSAAVRALRSREVKVSGEVPDVRPFLRHADVVVAPMRVSPGLPNKILEAMSCGQPVVISKECAEVLCAGEDAGLLSADLATDFVQQINRLLSSKDFKASMGKRARNFVAENFRWDEQMAILDRYLPAPLVECHA